MSDTKVYLYYILFSAFILNQQNHTELATCYIFMFFTSSIPCNAYMYNVVGACTCFTDPCWQKTCPNLEMRLYIPWLLADFGLTL